MYAKHNEQCYHKYYQQQAQRRNVHLERFSWSKALTKGHSCYSSSKNLQELYKHGMHKTPPLHSRDGDSADYDTEGNDHMKEVLAEMPPLTSLPLAPSLKQVPPTTSRAGQQPLLLPPLPPLPPKQQLPPLPPLPPMPLPTTSGTSGTTKLLWQALHTPPASEAE